MTGTRCTSRLSSGGCSTYSQLIGAGSWNTGNCCTRYGVQGIVTTLAVLRRHVARLRAKLAPGRGPDVISTEPCVGYRLAWTGP